LDTYLRFAPAAPDRDGNSSPTQDPESKPAHAQSPERGRGAQTEYFEGPSFFDASIGLHDEESDVTDLD
jgi:hypothetical protein